MKGQLREIIVKELLLPLLPPDVGVGTGQIISAFGETSTQQDLILYSKSLIPPVAFEGDLGAFPLESVLVTIEVKSRITAENLKLSDKAAIDLSKFRYAPPVGSSAYGADHHIEHLIPYLLAFDSDLDSGGITEAERYDRYRDCAARPGILNLCVAGRGFWFWADSSWNRWHEDGLGSELVNMVATIINSHARILLTRRQPDLRNYLLPYASPDGTEG